MPLDLRAVHQNMLDSISKKYQKSPGYPAYDFTMAFAVAIMELDGDVEAAEWRQNVDNLTGLDLDTYIKQHRGIIRKYATYATATLRVVAGAGEIQAGDLFATETGIEFYATTDMTVREGETFPVRAYNAGAAGNVGPNTITVMPVTIPGIGAVTNDEAAVGGYDDETDEEFRDRFYSDLQNPNNGCNQQAYLSWATSVPGVGRAKCFPQAFGLNTVEICVVDSRMRPANEDIVDEVQNLIDPNRNGDGAGEAPIGAVCTVTVPDALSIRVEANVDTVTGANREAIRLAIEDSVDSYLRGIAFKQGSDHVSYTQIVSRVNGTEGVLDSYGLTLNGGTANIELGDRVTPVLEEVVMR